MKKVSILLCGGLIATFFIGRSYAQFGFDKINPLDVSRGVTKMVKGASGVGLNEELSIGGSVALEIVASHGGLVKDADLTRRVNLIGKSLVLYSDRPELKYRFGVLNSPEINAFSAPGGYVFVTKAACDAATSDDELAGILAHEICHVASRHALRIISRNEFISGMTEVARGASQDFAKYDMGVSNVSRTVLKTGYDTGTELDADRKGTQLAYWTGYARNGLLSFLQKIKAMGGKTSVFSTHASLDSRISNLQGGGSSSNDSTSVKKKSKGPVRFGK